LFINYSRNGLCVQISLFIAEMACTSQIIEYIKIVFLLERNL